MACQRGTTSAEQTQRRGTDASVTSVEQAPPTLEHTCWTLPSVRFLLPGRASAAQRTPAPAASGIGARTPGTMVGANGVQHQDYR